MEHVILPSDLITRLPPKGSSCPEVWLSQQESHAPLIPAPVLTSVLGQPLREREILRPPHPSGTFHVSQELGSSSEPFLGNEQVAIP